MITRRVKREPNSEMLRLCAELAAGYIRRMASNELGSDAQRVLSRWPAGWRLPKGAEWKTRALGILQRRMMARARFVDRALRSVEDGLVVADVDGVCVVPLVTPFMQVNVVGLRLENA